MPTYEYRCAPCGNTFDEFQRITAEPHATCPKCGSDDCTRLISGGTFHLKGSGWYASDYGGKGRSGTAASRQAAAASGSADSAGGASTDAGVTAGATGTGASGSGATGSGANSGGSSAASTGAPKSSSGSDATT